MDDDTRDHDRLKAAILERMTDLAEEKHLGLAMIMAGFDGLTGPHRDLPRDPATLALIQENYPDATPALIGDRALDEDGLKIALAAAETLARIYVDYSPLSHWAGDMANDEEMRPAMSADVEAILTDLSNQWLGDGASLFGVTCTIILTAVRESLWRGLPWPKAARICLDALRMNYTMPNSVSDGEGLAVFAERMGISKNEARKYVEAAREADPATRRKTH
jgi:hypothetical protein